MKLRADVRLEVSPEGTGALSDPVLGRRIKLDARGVALCGALIGDGAEVDAVAAVAGTTAEVVKSFTDKLVSLDLCATPRAAERVAERLALQRVRAEPDKHVRFLGGARFACTMCGSCCGGHNVGPVSEAVLDGLEADGALAALEDEVRAARRLDKDLFVTLPGSVPADQRATPGADVMCHASGGSCVFLDDLGKCRIHAKLGGEKKPLPCRIFPWELVATPTGVRVAVQRECRDFLNATGPEAPTLEAARAEVEGLLRALAVTGSVPAARPIPVLRGRELASWAEWEALEARLARALDDAGSDVGGTFRAFDLVIGTDPTKGEPFAAWRGKLLAPLQQMVRAAPPANDKMVIRIDAAKIAITGLEAARGWVLARALEPLEGGAATLFREHLRHALWSTAPLRATSVEAGIGRLAAEWVLARLIALTRAREVKRFHVTTQDLQDGLVIASFLFRHDDLQPLLAELDALTVAVFVDGLERFFAHAADEDGPDRKIELVKF